MPKQQLLVAHRGFSGRAPENTRLAFDAAAIYGFQGIELDVHLSADEQIVVCHDETVDRTSDIKGEIRKLTLEQLRKGNFAYHHSLKRIPVQQIMTLEEVLESYLTKFQLINIELKTDFVHYQNIEKKVALLIKKFNALDRIMISSFNFTSLEMIKQFLPEIKTGFLFETIDQWSKTSRSRIKATCHFLNPKYALYCQNRLQFEELHLPFNFWTVRDKNCHLEIWNNPHCYSQITNFMF